MNLNSAPNTGRTREQVEALVLGHVAVRPEDWPKRKEILKPLIDRILETGECVWHANAMINGVKCWCVKCMPNGVFKSGGRQ